MCSSDLEDNVPCDQLAAGLIMATSRKPGQGYDDFVREILVGGLGAKAVVVGEDFHFGHKRQGNVGLLRAMGAELDFDVVPIELLDLDQLAVVVPGAVAVPAAVGGDPAVSSTAIRAALAVGDLDRASGSIRSWLSRASALKRYSECSGKSPLDAARCRERPTREVATLGPL